MTKFSFIISGIIDMPSKEDADRTLAYMMDNRRIECKGISIQEEPEPLAMPQYQVTVRPVRSEIRDGNED
jgi:hypothetical protein